MYIHITWHELLTQSFHVCLLTFIWAISGYFVAMGAGVWKAILLNKILPTAQLSADEKLEVLKIIQSKRDEQAGRERVPVPCSICHGTKRYYGQICAHCAGTGLADQ